MKDMLGHEQPDPPAMTASLPLRVFRLNDCEWWLATTLEEARADYIKLTGCSPEDGFDDPGEISEEALDRLHFYDADENEAAIRSSRRTFREELRRQIEADPITPRLFACTEY